MLIKRTLSSSVPSNCLYRFSWSNLLTFSLSPKIYTCLEMCKLFSRRLNRYNPSEILHLLAKQEIAKDKGLLVPCGSSEVQKQPWNCFLFHEKSVLFVQKKKKKKCQRGRTNKANEAKSRWQKRVVLKFFCLSHENKKKHSWLQSTLFISLLAFLNISDGIMSLSGDNQEGTGIVPLLKILPNKLRQESVPHKADSRF